MRIGKHVPIFSLFLLPLSFVSAQPHLKGQWSNVIPMPIIPVAAANLPDGKVLTWSAYDRFAFGGNNGMTYTAIFDPATNQSQEVLVTNTQHDMFCPGINNLPDGRILVNGGSSSNRTSIYDPSTNSWSDAGDMNIPRGYQGNVTLPDGGAFTIGGSWSGGNGNKHAEIWRPATGWTLLPGVPVAPILDGVNDPAGVYSEDNHAWLFPAPNGLLFHAGPSANMNWIDVSGNGGYSSAGPRSYDGYSMNGTITMYDIGKLLKTGGASTYSAGTPANNRCFTIDINSSTPVVTDIPDMQRGRTYHNAVVLPTGEVVVFGGCDVATVFSDQGFQQNNTPELYDPVANAWTDMAPMATPRTYHSVALLLPDARVLVGGSGLCGVGCPQNHPNVEIFSPPYLFNTNGSLATRPVINTSPASANYNEDITVSTNSAVSSFVLIRFSSVTHSLNNEQRRIPVNFTSQGGNTYTVSIPGNNLLPPGYYMLFALNSAGVPSVSRNLLIGGGSTPPPPPPPPAPTFTSDLRYLLKARHSGKIAAVLNASTADNTRLVQQTDNGNKSRMFELISLGNDQYRINVVHTGKCIGTQNGSSTNGAQVVQQPWTGADHQKWELEQNSEGYWLLKNVKSNRYLDVNNSSQSNNANFVAKTLTGNPNQQFSLVSILPETQYVIEARHSNKPMRVDGGTTAEDGNVIQYDHSNGANYEIWVLDYLGNETYRLKAKHNNKYMATEGGGDFDGANVVQQTWTGADHQKWKFVPTSNGYYRINNLKSGKALDVYGSSSNDGANIVIWYYDGSPNQQFRFVLAVEGSFSLKARHSGKLASISGGSTAQDAFAVQGETTGASSQKWVLDYVGNGHFRLKAKHTNKYLGVLGGSTVNGANVVQQTWAAADHQRWSIEYVSDGYYVLRNQKSAKVLSVVGGSLDEGADLVIGPQTGAEYEQWELVPVDGTANFRVAAPAQASFLIFSASETNGAVALSWSLDNAEGIESFRVERSADGQQFATLATIAANDSSSYASSDRVPLKGKNLYRIVALGEDGSSFFSETRELQFDGAAHELLVFPNPLNKGRALILELRQSEPAPAQAVLADLRGNRVGEISFGGMMPQEMAQFDTEPLAAGVYVLTLNGEGWQEVRRIVVK